MDTASITIALGTIVVFGVGAQWLARITGIPSIVLLLSAGILAGPITGLVDPEELLGDTLDPAITLAVGLLLFDSGFSLRLDKLPDGLDVVDRLVSVGAIVTWLIGWLASWLIFDLDVAVAALLGAVLVVSGPTVVGPIVRASRPRGTTGKVLEWEGAILDPIGATLGAALLTVFTTDTGPVLGTIAIVAATIALGVLVGGLCAAVFVVAWRNYAIPDDLQVPVAFMFAVLAFTVAGAILSEAGLFATLTLGLALANQPFASIAQVRRFQASLGALIVATLFIVLAATLDLGELGAVLVPSALLLAVLVLVARPLSAFLCTLGTDFASADRGFIASVAPRGIVAASTVSYYSFVLNDNGFDADEMVPVTFAIIIGAGIVYGFGSPLMARRLGVSRGTAHGVALFGSLATVAPLASTLGAAGVPVLVVDHQAGRDEHDAGEEAFEVFRGDILSDDLLEAISSQDVGTAVVGTGDRGVDFVAMRRCVRTLTKAKTFYVPRRPPGQEGDVEMRWRARTPDRFVAFGPDVSREALHEVLAPVSSFTWLPVDTADDQMPDGAIPLFIVTDDGRGIVATQHSLSAARDGAQSSTSRLLCAHP